MTALVIFIFLLLEFFVNLVQDLFAFRPFPYALMGHFFDIFLFGGKSIPMKILKYQVVVDLSVNAPHFVNPVLLLGTVDLLHMN